ncbi:uncharacterized protein BXZ73DRAFT_89263 [Epithele typhae]|uniref:uncharacterized protein n=1 Tax=Epithele typhae TaxID=378194 RepID=UPI002008979A|nr:uncharacterized protein BXZ73DRAFT_89263 [Epithele typhae]KAH9937848.1 hypothetical protein BXZ73DRAFT_89263 [Epithele typhae]
MPPWKILIKRDPPTAPLDDSDLNLDISGVVGFFGGDVAVSAMATVHIYEARKYLGWYNTPGSYEVAKRYGQVAKSRFWDGLYPGINHDPAVLFELDGSDGPRYRGVQSGTVMRKTGHLGNLFLAECKACPSEGWKAPPDARVTSPSHVIIAHCLHAVSQSKRPRLTKAKRVKTSLFALIPILSSIATAGICAWFEDWISFSVIVLGMVTSGISCYIIGTGKLDFTRPEPGKGSSPAHGILDERDHVVILKGPKTAINTITRGRFTLEYEGSKRFARLGISSSLLTIQFLAQLLAIPQATNFGQVMFLASLGVSWIYNSYLSSIDREKLQRHILMKKVLRRPLLRKYTFGTRTAMVVFTLLVLALDLYNEELHSTALADSDALRTVLDDLLPNDTPAWRFWKTTIVNDIPTMLRGQSVYRIPALHVVPPNQKKLLVQLYKDADMALAAFDVYKR